MSIRRTMCCDLVGLFMAASVCVAMIATCMYQAGIALQGVVDVATLRVPSTLGEAQVLHDLLKAALAESAGLSAQLWPWIVALFASIYIFKQAFSIPGSVLLNIFAGAMFGVYAAFPIVCLLTVAGTSFCYLLSSLFGRRIAMKVFGPRVDRVRNSIRDHRSNLFFYLVALRFFPFTPNFLLNLASPLVGIPYKHFIFSVLFGLMPYNLITTKAGGVLGEINHMNEVLDKQNLLQLALLAGIALLPVIFRSRLEKFAALEPAAAMKQAKTKRKAN